MNAVETNITPILFFVLFCIDEHNLTAKHTGASPAMAKNDRKRISRRGFLIGIPLGVAGAFALNAIGGRLLAPKRDSYPKFPEGSIFTPADDRRQI